MQRWIECSNTGSTCRSITKHLELRVAENGTLTLEFRLPKPDILSSVLRQAVGSWKAAVSGSQPFLPGDSC